MARKKIDKNQEHVMDPIVFLNAINTLCKEKDIEKEVIVEAMQNGFASAYRRHYKSNANVKVDIDMNTGVLTVRAYKIVVENDEDEEFDSDLHIPLDEAVEIDPTITVGEHIYEVVTPSDFGRVAISTAKQVVIQRLKEAEKESIMEEFKNKEYEMLLGQVSREDEFQYYIDLGKIHGLLPKDELIPNEKIEMGSNIKVFVSKIDTTGKNPLILLSRKHYGFVKKLFELEIPEISTGDIEVHTVARDAGFRSKVAVLSHDENIDPVGTCIGERGNRINRIIKELKGEKIDVIPYSEDLATFIEAAMSPARLMKVVIEDETKNEAIAVVDKENFSLAIGKMGQNVKLAAKLTRCKIDVKTIEDFLNKEEVINENSN